MRVQVINTHSLQCSGCDPEIVSSTKCYSKGFHRRKNRKLSKIIQQLAFLLPIEKRLNFFSVSAGTRIPNHDYLISPVSVREPLNFLPLDPSGLLTLEFTSRGFMEEVVTQGHLSHQVQKCSNTHSLPLRTLDFSSIPFPCFLS